MPIRPPDRLIARLLVAGVLLGSLASCARRGACTGDYCGTVVIAAAGEPDILLPPVTELSTSRDVYDQLFLKLADLGMSGNTIGELEEQLVVHVAAGGELGHGREQDVGLAGGGDHHGAAIVAGASATPGAGSERAEQHARDQEPGDHAVRWSDWHGAKDSTTRLAAPGPGGVEKAGGSDGRTGGRFEPPVPGRDDGLGDLGERDRASQHRGERRRGSGGVRLATYGCDHVLRPVEQNRAVLQQGRALPQLGRAHELASVHEHLTSDRRREAGTGVVEGDRGWSRAVGGERRIGP